MTTSDPANIVTQNLDDDGDESLEDCTRHTSMSSAIARAKEFASRTNMNVYVLHVETIRMFPGSL